jgi:hypothetical protein
VEVATGTVMEKRVDDATLKCTRELKKKARRAFDCLYDSDREILRKYLK